MLKQIGFILDANRCLGCGACLKACQINHNLPPTLTWRTIRKIEDESSDGKRRFYLSSACNHCANPECMRVCPSGAYSKRRDGIVVHNSSKCMGCKSCVASCPFSVPKIHPETGKATKCLLCYDRLDLGMTPYCVKACPTRALLCQEIHSISLDQLIRLTAPLPGLRLTNPSVYYKEPRRLNY
ncbi:4Fe-4S dicluster domain-containing protein [Desulfosporosinus sp. FKB]|uniref:4Fe-4S dicluster domain-containing protein n=1 Tax=Desulfosporosinus sp. FKB TaxID=1969835 RepID=UPI000B4A3EF7|nr:4Fe-4S dicluster domain-containing protein [Desulfosporosinus sp. FKB]